MIYISFDKRCKSNLAVRSGFHTAYDNATLTKIDSCCTVGDGVFVGVMVFLSFKHDDNDDDDDDDNGETKHDSLYV